MGLMPEIERRTSVREFAPRPIDEAHIRRIMEAGRRAPSAKNRQAWRFIVIQDADTKARIKDAAFGQEAVGSAPALIALCTTNIEYRMPNGQLSYPMDLSIAASFMILQAVHEGLGTCPVTTFQEEEVKSILTVPHSMRVVMLLAVGYPVSKGEATNRLPVDRVVSYDHW
jgi:nitroreductase